MDPNWIDSYSLKELLPYPLGAKQNILLEVISIKLFNSFSDIDIDQFFALIRYFELLTNWLYISSLIGCVIDPTNEQNISLSLDNLFFIGEHIRGIGIPPALPPALKCIVSLGKTSLIASSCCEIVKYFLVESKLFNKFCKLLTRLSL